MASQSSKQQRFFQAVKGAKNNKNAPEHLQKIAESMPLSNLNEFCEGKADFRLKKAMLGVLKDIREPMYLEETDEPDSIEAVADKQEIKDKDWDTYIKPFVGQPLLPKELEAVNTFKSETGKSPTNQPTGRVIELWYKGTNKMNQSQTTVIKKMKDGTQYSFNAFSKFDKPSEDKAEEPPMDMAPEAEPSGGPGDLGIPPEGNAPQGSTPPPEKQPESKKERNYSIVFTKSVLFTNEIEGGKILVKFLKELNL